MPKVGYIHRGYILDGHIYYDRPEMYVKELQGLEGFRFQMTIEKEHESISKNQRGYYFGGIIRAELMNSNIFSGFTEKEIHQMLLEQLRSYNKTIINKDKTETSCEFVEDFASYGKEEMTKYIDDVINYVTVEFNIPIKSSDEYKLNQYVKVL